MAAGRGVGFLVQMGGPDHAMDGPGLALIKKLGGCRRTKIGCLLLEHAPIIGAGARTGKQNRCDS